MGVIGVIKTDGMGLVWDIRLSWTGIVFCLQTCEIPNENMQID